MTPQPIILTTDERDDASDAAYLRIDKRGGDPKFEQQRCCAELVIAKITGYPWRIMDDYPNECISIAIGSPPEWTVDEDNYTALRPYIAAHAHAVDWAVTLYGWAFGFEFVLEEKCYLIKKEQLARSEALCNWCRSMGRPWVANKKLEIIGM